MLAFFVSPWIAVAAIILDHVFDKPKPITHPVVYIGDGLDMLEKWSWRLHTKGILGVHIGMRTLGVFSLALALFCTANVVAWLCALPLVGYVIALFFATFGLALGNLLYAGKEAHKAIENGTLEEARVAVSMLVSRNTSTLNRPALRRALAETLSENFNDAFVAPLFYLAIGGPVLLWCYKCVSTMDSMWGYRTKRFEELGWAGARLDDILAWIPARMSVFFLGITAPFVGLKAPKDFWTKVKEDAQSMESPNAGWPMAAAAWLHGAYMGGPSWYFGELKQKPVLGPRPEGGLNPEDICTNSDTEGAEAANTDGDAKLWSGKDIVRLMKHIRFAGIACAVLVCLVLLILDC